MVGKKEKKIKISNGSQENTVPFTFEEKNQPS